MFAVVELAHRVRRRGPRPPPPRPRRRRVVRVLGRDARRERGDGAGADRRRAARVGRTAFDGDRDATVHDLYPVVVDQIARDRLRAARRPPRSPLRAGRPTAVEAFLDGLTAADAGASLATPAWRRSQQKLSRWVDGGSARRSAARWTLGLHLDERRRRGSSLELWLHAEDDPTLSLPASLLEGGGDEIFTFLRASDPRRDLARQLAEIEPLLAEHGIRFDAAAPSEAGSTSTRSGLFLREAMPQLEERGVPVLLPAAWLRSPSRLRVDLTATSGPAARSSGLLSTAALATFDWRSPSATSSSPRRSWPSSRARRSRSSASRAAGTRSGTRRSSGRCASSSAAGAASGSSTSSARSRASRPTRRASSSARCTLDAPLAELLGEGDARFRPLPTPAAMQLRALPLPGARPRLAAAARRPRRRRDPRRRHGARQDRAGDRDARLRARGARRRRARPDARRLPDERRPAVGRRDRAVRAVAARPPPPRQRPLGAARAALAARRTTSSSPRTTSPRATSTSSPRSRGTGSCSTRRRTSRTRRRSARARCAGCPRGGGSR